MTAQTVRSVLIFTLALVPLVMSGKALAEVDQQLDSVDAISNKVALEMQLDDRGDCGKDAGGNPAKSYDCTTSALPSSGVLPSDDPLFASNGGIPAALTSFAACQRSADRSLFCLLNSLTYQGKIRQPVTVWSENGDADDLFDCTDPALRLDGRRANPCSSITVDLAGNLWLGGRDGSSHSVIKVVAIQKGTLTSPSTCPAGFPATATLPAEPMQKLQSLSADNDFCFLRYATGRPILVDMFAVDGRDARYFQGPGSAAGKGVLVLEDRRTAVFIADRTQNGAPVRPVPVEIASGKAGWGLIGNESVQSLTLLQLCPNVVSGARECGANDNRDNYALVTTSTGRVVARWMDPPSGTNVLPFQVYLSPAPPSGATVVPQYWVRVSQQTGLVYVSDRSANKVRLLSVPVQFPSSGSTTLVLRDDTLWTSDATQSVATTAVPAPNTLNTISVSPGIGVDLSKCGVDALVPCDLYPDGGDDNQVGAQISNVQLASSSSGLAVFRVTGIPDCRFPMPTDELTAICAAAGAVEGASLRVDKLLPPEVLDLFDENTTPKRSELRLLIGPQFRARPPGNTFDAFFGRTEEGVVFRQTFDLKFDIGELTGSLATRCGFDPGGSTTSPKNAGNWDAVVTVSERHVTAGSSPTPDHQDMLVNSDCENPTSGSGDRWSLYAYGLMPAVCVNSSSDDCKRWFATLLGDLFIELEAARDQTACNNVDGNAVNPLNASTCQALQSAWAGTKPKLDNCINAALERKQSAADENCQAFLTQFRQYEAVLDSATVNGGASGDKANRLGELKARRNVLLYIYRDQFLPSIPFLP
jgi:hypothetical protein